MSETAVARGSIETVSDMMQALQDEINAIKDGSLEESKARIVSKFRSNQLKTAELQLQYARLTKGRIPDPELKLIKTKSDEPK
jgi:hypothetical protein